MAAAKARADQHAAEIERLSSAPATAAAEDTILEQIQAAHRQKALAEDEYAAGVRRAQTIRDWLQDTGDAAARTIRGIRAPYHPPRRNLFQRAAGWLADTAQDATSAVDRFVDEHAELLRNISGGLKAVSTAAGLLSFVPVLTPIMAPIATATAGTALALDATLVVSGHGNWREVAVDGALMALPGAGRLASRTVMSRQAGRAVAQYADEVQRLNLPAKSRLATVSTLRTRNWGTSSFHGASRGDTAFHPHLQQALDRVPASRRSDFHGKCAEIRAIDRAIKDGAVWTMQWCRPGRSGRPVILSTGPRHRPCRSCTWVLRDLNIKYME